RCRTICFAVWAPMRPNTSPSSCSVSTRSPTSAPASNAFACSIVISVNSSSISPTTRRARKTRILPVSASIRTWMSSWPATRRYADWMPSSTAPISCSREICFSALSCRRAPTKSRLTMASVLCACRYVRPAQKRNVGVTHVAERPFSCPKVYTRTGGPSTGRGSLSRRVSPGDVVLQDVDELRHEAVAAQRAVEAAVDEHRRNRLLERAREADPDVRMLRLTRAIDHAAHHRDAQLLGAGMALAPLRHPFLEIGLDLLGHLLEEGRRGPAAARTGAHLRQERSQPHRLEDLLGDLDLALARGARLRRQGDPD